MTYKDHWDAVVPLAVEDIFDLGVLWYINRVAFHPRGLALGISRNEKNEIEEFSIMRAVGEPVCFPAETDDEKFKAFESLLDHLGDLSETT